MPFVEIWGLPELLPKGELRVLKKTLAKAIAYVKPLGINEDTVTIMLPHDLLAEDLGEILTAKVFIYSADERTVEVRTELAQRVTEVLTDFSMAFLDGKPRSDSKPRPECRQVEVYITTDSSQVDKTCAIYAKHHNFWEENLQARRPKI